MIDVKNLSKSFGDHLVLDNISEHIEEGEKVVISGPSGSGRSTFLRRLTPLESIIARKTRERVIALIVLWAAFAILFPLNAYLEQYSLPLMIFSAGLSVVGIYFCVLHIIALTKMK